MSCAPHPARPRSTSTPQSESDSRSNAIRIKRSRTLSQPPKFDIQPFQRVTSSRIFPCDRSPLVSGDYKLRGRGGYPCSKAKTPNSEQKCCPMSPLLSSACASALLTSLLFSVACANPRGEGGTPMFDSKPILSNSLVSASPVFPCRISSFEFRVSALLARRAKMLASPGDDEWT